MRKTPICLLVIGLCLVASTTHAKRFAPTRVPEPLVPWIGWVLHDQKDRQCPFVYTDATDRRCAWPTALTLTIAPDQGRFEQTWEVYADSWIPLPGGGSLWPIAVTINRRPALVAERDGRPAVNVSPGRYRIMGEFPWPHPPKSITIPPDTGLVSVRIGDTVDTAPQVDARGRLWLKPAGVEPTDRTVADRMGIQVFRHIRDAMPMQVDTVIRMDVSGRPREEVLAHPLLVDFTALAVDSPLPARLEPDGRLRVQVRPGQWQLRIQARHPGQVTALACPPIASSWPDKEIWAFEAQPHLRLVEPTGAPVVDPRHTRTPESWHQWPTFQLTSGDTLTLPVTRRGDPTPDPDQLALARTIWLDFDGAGCTIQDTITGTKRSGWRMETHDTIALGQVTIDGRPQLITTVPGSDRPGVEVRQGTLKLVADSRYEGPLNAMPATGWRHDFHRVQATLHLPPGWELLSVRGVDSLPNTWLNRWSLLDMFLVLITALAAGRLWAWRQGALVLVTLVLIWHAPGAPRMVWLHLLAAIALTRYLPTGRLRTVITWYRMAAVLILVVISLPFAVHQVRTGLYPQLERPGRLAGMQRKPMAVPVSAKKAIKMESSESESPAMRRRSSVPGKLGGLEIDHAAPAMDRIDPSAVVQTGPGLPKWRWTAIPLGWSGPVRDGQSLRMTVMPPGIKRLLHLIRVVLLALTLGLIIKAFRPWPPDPWPRTAAAVVAAGILILTIPPGGIAQAADFPSPEILSELKERLMAPPDCLPQCAVVNSMALAVKPTALTATLSVHAQATVAVPLPGQKRHWLPESVTIDGTPASSLQRSPDGRIWAQLERGQHRIQITGRLPDRPQVQIHLPMIPHMTTVSADGWSIAGVHAGGRTDTQLELTRDTSSTASSAAAALTPAPLPPFMMIHRTLHLDLDWTVTTRVERQSPPGTAIVAKVPLWPGESVITEGIMTVDDSILINLAPNQQALSWQSVIAPRSEMVLTAPNATGWLESWALDAGPIWHVAVDGIPVVHHQDAQGHWLPRWRPWPGETVTLAIQRPGGVDGQVLTIDQSRQTITPGHRAVDTTLALSIRSSHGGQHEIGLPSGARLQNVTIDGKTRQIRLDDSGRLPLPLTPGIQQVAVTWQTDATMETMFRTASVDLNAPSVNAAVKVKTGRDRWILLAGGPRLGPAVLFWGVLVVLAGAALALGRMRVTPLKWWHWLLLGIGLSQTSIWMGVVVVGWLVAMGYRLQLSEETPPLKFNAIQLGLAVLSLLALSSLVIAVQQGLLGWPDMQIAGNGSSARHLNWYADRADPQLPTAWILSVPLLAYRLLMLAWALWLALALLSWLRWGWVCVTTHGMWRTLPRKKKTNNFGLGQSRE